MLPAGRQLLADAHTRKAADLKQPELSAPGLSVHHIHTPPSLAPPSVSRSPVHFRQSHTTPLTRCHLLSPFLVTTKHSILPFSLCQTLLGVGNKWRMKHRLKSSRSPTARQREKATIIGCSCCVLWSLPGPRSNLKISVKLTSSAFVSSSEKGCGPLWSRAERDSE